MDALVLARWQFGITTVFHYLFVPVTIGLAPIVAVLHTAYYRTGKDVYRRATRFWGKLFLINFAIGVVTGIVQEFQFGMAWSEYSRFVGDIFGAPLALEALLAFFLESTFLGLWIFGWDRLPPRLHLASIWLVAIGTTVSAYFILVANSFMQWPVGYEVDATTGRATLTDFWAVLTNPHVLRQFPHTVLAAYATAGFIVLAVSSWYLLRKRQVDLFRRSATLGIGVAVVASIGVGLVGHEQAQLMTRMQPMKMASAEALWDTESSAGMSLFAVGDIENGRNHINVQIPRGLSLLATNSLDGTVEGINDVQAEYQAKYGPGDYRPNIGVVYWTFRAMAGAGVVMVLLTLWGIWLVRRRRLTDLDDRWVRRFHRFGVVAVALPFLANITGWIMTEMGRQPWIVFGVMTTDQALSPNMTTFTIALSLILFTLIYGVLAVVEGWLVVRHIRSGPEPEPEDEGADDAPTEERRVSVLVAY